jgi:hypothetical protein
MSQTTKAHVTIDLDDVRHADGQTIESAILAWAERSDTTASGTVGPAFSTSGPGPGPGWSQTHDASDFAERAVSDEYGALAYIDESDGRLAARPGWTEEGTSGEHELEWSDDSVVRIECPSIEDAIEHPAIVAEMVRSVIDYHGVCSDRKEWHDLIQQIQSASEELSRKPAEECKGSPENDCR